MTACWHTTELEGITTSGFFGAQILDLGTQEHSPPITVFLSWTTVGLWSYLGASRRIWRPVSPPLLLAQGVSTFTGSNAVFASEGPSIPIQFSRKNWGGILWGFWQCRCSLDDYKLCCTGVLYPEGHLRPSKLEHLSSMSPMFEENGVKLGTSKDSFSEVYLMNVVLDRSASPRTGASVASLLPNKALYALDNLFTICLAFVPNTEIFNCARDRVHTDVGAGELLIPLLMS